MAIRDYEDFLIRINPESKRGEGYPVAVIRSPAGESRGDIRMSLRVDQSPLLDDLLAFRQGDSNRERLKKIGSALFEALFNNSESCQDKQHGQLNQLFASSLTRVTKPSDNSGVDRGLRIRLDIRAPDLHNVPWELLTRPDEHALFLSPVPATPIVRHLEASWYVMSSLRITLPLRVLLVLVNQNNSNSLDITESNIRNALSPLGGKVRITAVRNPNLSEIRALISRGNNHVFHYAGPIVRNFEKQACLSLGDDGKNPRLSSELLATYLQGSSIRLVVLNASGTSHELAPTIIRAGMPAVVAMQADVGSEEVECFAKSFYAPVAELYPIEFAVCEARMALQGEFGIGTGHWIKPVLFMISDTGHLFDLAEASSVQPKWSDEELEKIETFKSLIDLYLGYLDTMHRKRLELNKDVWDLLDEEEGIYLKRLQDLKKSLIEMGAIEALPDSISVK